MRDAAKAIEFAGRALAIDSDHGLARWHMALGRLESGMLNRRTWDFHEARLIPGITRTEVRNYHGSTPTPWWQG